MKLSIKWLSRYVDLEDLSPEQIRDAVTMSTAEVEDILTFGQGLDDVVVGEVLKKEKHPDADKLSLCQVDVGNGDPLSIVCGAPNVKKGQKVVVVQPGQQLPDGTRIKKTKIRGQVSLGMICSERELGLSEDHEGIIVLEKGAKVGRKYIDQADVVDHVLEIDNKSVNHRPDLWGHLGFARELAAIFDRPLKNPVVPQQYPEKGERRPVVIDDKAACPRYIGLVLNRVRVIRSPDWLRMLLHATDVRSINLPVDLTNFVMMELGQPMHAFDLRHLHEDGIRVRFAADGEQMATLDGMGRELTSQDLLITSGKDGSEPVALAGIMGGEGSMVADDTTQLFLESANFHPTTIRRSSQRLGLRTDSSARFEKSLDPAQAEAAVHRFTEMLCELCQGAEAAGPLVDPAHWQFQPRSIQLRRARLDLKLGIQVPDEQVCGIFRGLQFDVQQNDDGFEIGVPSFRATKDITIEDDLIEEVGRMYRYDNIPEIPLRTVVAVPPREQELTLFRQMLQISALEMGCNEVYNYSFVPDQVLSAVGAQDQQYVLVENPVAPEINKLRRHVLPSLLGALPQNLRERSEVRLVEHGKGYHPEKPDSDGLPHESRELALVYASREGEPYGLLRSHLVSLLQRLGFPPQLDELRRSDDLPFLHPGRTVALQRDAVIYGYVGILHPEACRRLEVPDTTAVATVDVRQMIKAGQEEKKYDPIPRFPPQPVDVAFLVPGTARVGDLEKFLRQINPKLVRDVELFEVYRGEGMAAGQKSLNFTVTLGAEDRTLSTKDEEKYLGKVRERCGEVGAELRG